MSHLLLLGATGFLGTHIHTAARHHPRVEKVTTLGRDRCDLHTITVTDLADLLRHLAPTAVINATGRLDGTHTDLITANTLATAKLIDAIATATPTTRLVRLGSAGEYGPIPPGHAATEDHPTNPISAYGHSHLAATGLLHHATTTGTINGVTLRVFNPIGPGTGPATLLGAVATQLRHAITTSTPTIHTGPLTTHRDFIDARDVATATIAAALTPTTHPILNIGSGHATPIRHAVETLATHAGYTGTITEDQPTPGRSNTITWTQADITRATHQLTWTPQHTLTDSLKAIWAEFAPNRDAG